MSLTFVVVINLIITFLLVFFVITLLFRIRHLEDKSVDLSLQDVVAFVEQMRDMVVESEMAAERLDTAIKEREAVLEDLNDLIDTKLHRIATLTAFEQEPTAANLPLGGTPLQTKAYQLLMQGKSEAEIAAALKISLTEASILINKVKR